MLGTTAILVCTRFSPFRSSERYTSLLREFFLISTLINLDFTELVESLESRLSLLYDFTGRIIKEDCLGDLPDSETSTPAPLGIKFIFNF